MADETFTQTLETVNSRHTMDMTLSPDEYGLSLTFVDTVSMYEVIPSESFKPQDRLIIALSECGVAERNRRLIDYAILTEALNNGQKVYSVTFKFKPVAEGTDLTDRRSNTLVDFCRQTDSQVLHGTKPFRDSEIVDPQRMQGGITSITNHKGQDYHTFMLYFTPNDIQVGDQTES